MAQLENFRLKVFRTVAELLSFRKAAEQLFLTQPAVTLQIKALEDDLGVRVFDRTGGRVSLTPPGGLLLRHAQRIFRIIAEAEQELAAGEGQLSGELALGVSTTIAQYVLPRLIGAFLAEHPRVRFSLHSGNTEEIVQLLLRDKVSIGLIEGPSRHREVRTEPFMDDEMVLIAHADFTTGRISRHELLAWAVAKELELRTVKTVEVAGLRITRHLCLVSRTSPEPQGPSASFRDFALERARLVSSSPRKLAARSLAHKFG